MNTFLKRYRKALKRSAIALGAVIVVLVLASAAHALVYRDQIYPGVFVGNVAVENLSKAEAQKRLADYLAGQKETTFYFTIEGRRFDVANHVVGATYDSVGAAEQAFLVGRQSNPLRRLAGQVRSLFTKQAIPFAVNFDAKKDAFVRSVQETVDHPEQDASIVFEQNSVVIKPAKTGQRLTSATINNALLNAFGFFKSGSIPLALEERQPRVREEGAQDAKVAAQNLIRATLTVEAGKKTEKLDYESLQTLVHFPSDEKRAELNALANEEAIKKYVASLAEVIDQPAVDAKLGVQGGKVTAFSLSQDGLEIDQADATKRLTSAIKKILQTRPKAEDTSSTAGSSTATPAPIAETVTFNVKTTKPAVTSSDIEKLGLKELIGTATTDYSGSPENRKHNIATGVKYLSGALIKPGEALSVVKLLGSVDAATGYLPELVIKENQTIPEYGGGLCQVSTTLFRAALNAGLDITERQAHSYRVGYYERVTGPGLDATVYLPRPDLKIKNDTPGWILVQGKVGGDKVTFELYGTSDGRRSEISAVEIWDIKSPPPAEYIDTPDLPAGELKQVEKPHDGAKTRRVYRVYDKSGKKFREQTFLSTYKAWQARYLRGTGGAPAAPADPTETPPPSTATPTPTETATATPSPTP